MQTTKGGFGHRKMAIVIILVLGIAAALAVVATLPVNKAPLPNNTTTGTVTENALPQGLGSFKNYSELQSFISANAKSAQESNSNSGVFFGGVPIAMGTVNSAATFAASATDALSTQSSASYTGTNVQVKGVDEPDIVKTDGTHLFISTSDVVTIINAYPPNSTSVLSKLTFQGSSVLGIEIAQNRLLVINQRYTNASYIDLVLYDTTNLSAPKLMQNMSIAGNYVASRLTQGYFYAVIQEPSYIFNNGNATGIMPLVTENGTTDTLPPSSVYYAPTNAQIGYYTMVVSMSMSSGKESTISVLTGTSSTIYVSTQNIYVVYANYPQYYADNIPGDVFTGGVISPIDQQGGQNSTIFRASYVNGTVIVEAAGSVPGTVQNQFSLNEYNNYFMVATSRNAQIGTTYTISDDVYVLNMNMSQVSAVRNIAPGENLYAVSFVGDMGFVVTFQQVDPLFAISFQNITHPVIESALKVNGYSDYLYPLSNGNLIGVGKNTVPASTGNYSYYLGLKLSLFQVLPNGTSSDLSNYFMGDRGTDSPVLTNHLAFTLDPTRNIMVIPVTLAIVSGNQSTGPNSPPPYGNTVWQGVYIFNVTDSGFTLLGKVSQYPASQNYGDSPNNNLQIDRSVIIGNYLYTISQSEVMVSNMSTFATVSTVPLT
ncbi:MAG TPA: beta-propeller domain-containing protein [Nitrososphaerales archaeon]|nr:beta-propeller domain-containing protein [Nitrososphaerales archaeon]